MCLESVMYCSIEILHYNFSKVELSESAIFKNKSTLLIYIYVNIYNMIYLFLDRLFKTSSLVVLMDSLIKL